MRNGDRKQERETKGEGVKECRDVEQRKGTRGARWEEGQGGGG